MKTTSISIIILAAAVVLAVTLSLTAVTFGAETDHGSVTAQGSQTAQGGQTQQGGQSEQGKKPPSEYLKNLYVWFLGFVGIAALFALVMGGVMYMFAGANLTKTEAAKKWITNAIWGIVLAAVSVLLLRTINPDLVRGFDLEEVINNAIQKYKP